MLHSLSILSIFILTEKKCCPEEMTINGTPCPIVAVAAMGFMLTYEGFCLLHPVV